MKWTRWFGPRGPWLALGIPLMGAMPWMVGCEELAACSDRETRSCLCADGSNSIQTCEGGDGWGACMCREPEPVELDGQLLYRGWCTPCHADDGTGTQLGPDIRHDVGDEDFDELVEVILYGEDDMPPTPVTLEQAQSIATWARANLDTSAPEPADDD